MIIIIMTTKIKIIIMTKIIMTIKMTEKITSRYR